MIEHIAIWVEDLEGTKDFYCRYFGLQSGKKYINETKQFESYFLNFDLPGATRIELMRKTGVDQKKANPEKALGFTHFAISLGNRFEVDRMTEVIRSAGYTVVSEPRETGDGYYESVIEDYEGNWLELTI